MKNINYTKYQAYPVAIEFEISNFDAVTMVNQLEHLGFTPKLLNSASTNKATADSYISLHECFNYVLRNGKLVKHTPQGQKLVQNSLKVEIDQVLKAYQTPKIVGMPRFVGGFIGYFSYDYARYVNPTLPQQPKDPYQLNDADLTFVDQVLVYDHKTEKAHLVQILKQPTADKVQKVLTRLIALKQKLLTLPKAPKPEFNLTQPFKLMFDQPTFTKKVEQTKQHIYDGDIFQLILANAQHGKMTGTLLGIAEKFFQDNPTPYQFYYKHGDYETIGASPETLITRTGNHLFTYPLAGTRRRGRTPEEDAKFTQELQTDPKEISEHMMLVDLGRNDLGKVSKFGSVKVTKLRQLLKFAQVMHLGSTVESEADPTQTDMDIIASLMPAGTLSGAPKVRAMQLINELEDQKRGIYGGCLGYLSTTGDCDLCIGIRLAYRKGKDIFVHSGAGIVADSQPRKEYLEFNNKARAILLALTQTKAGDTHYVVSH